MPLHQATAGTADRHGHYLAALALFIVGVNALALLLPLGLFRTEWFRDWYSDWSKYQYEFLVRQRLSIKAAPNDVVVLGDSGALVGLRPDVIAKAGGPRVVNLALYGLSGFHAQTLLIEHYLATNPVPKLVVLYFSPHSIRWSMEADEARYYYESAYVDLLLAPPMLTARRMVGNPEIIPRLYGQVASRMARMMLALLKPETRQEMVDYRAKVESFAHSSNGGSSFALAGIGHDPVPISGGCYSEKADRLDFSGINSLRARIEARGIRTLFLVAPMPACDQAFTDYLPQFTGVADNQLEQRPSTEFFDRGHMTDQAATANSLRFRDSIGAVF